jgi:hypothetical protein
VSLKGIADLISQAEASPELLERLRREPDRAMITFDLTMTEIVALKAHDAAVLEAMGLDPLTARRWEFLWWQG